MRCATAITAILLAVPAWAQTANDVLMACKSPTVMASFVSELQKNYASARTMFQDMQAAGECRTIAKGTKVAIERDRGEAVCVKAGAGPCWWTMKSLLK